MFVGDVLGALGLPLELAVAVRTLVGMVVGVDPKMIVQVGPTRSTPWTLRAWYLLGYVLAQDVALESGRRDVLLAHVAPRKALLAYVEEVLAGGGFGHNPDESLGARGLLIG